MINFGATANQTNRVCNFAGFFWAAILVYQLKVVKKYGDNGKFCYFPLLICQYLGCNEHHEIEILVVKLTASSL